MPSYISTPHSSYIVSLCSANQSRLTPGQYFNSAVPPHPSFLSCPAAWLDRSGSINWTCPEERRRFLLWVRTLFRLGLYLFRCKSALKKCYVLSLCSGRWTGLICWRKSATWRLELCRLFPIIRLLLMWVGDIMQPHPPRLGWWERAPTPISYVLPHHSEGAGPMKLCRIFRGALQIQHTLDWNHNYNNNQYYMMMSELVFMQIVAR